MIGKGFEGGGCRLGEVPIRYVPGGNGDDHEKPESGSSVSQTRMEPDTIGIPPSELSVQWPDRALQR
jgi:hypothetical protein